MTSDLQSRTFHSGFSTASPDPGCVILQSNDNTHFYYSLPLLVKVSEFFKDLSELDLLPVPLPTSSSPLTTDTEETDAVDSKTEDPEYALIPPPSATATGLSYALHFVNSAVDGTPLPVIDKVDASMIVPALIDIARAYQIPYILTAMAGAYALDNPTDVFGSFALFAIADCPEWAIKALNSFAPGHLLRLYRLHLARPAALVRLQMKLNDSFPFPESGPVLHIYSGYTCSAWERHQNSVSESASTSNREAHLAPSTYRELFTIPLMEAVTNNWQDEWCASRNILIDFKSSCSVCKDIVLNVWRPILLDLLDDLKPTI